MEEKMSSSAWVLMDCDEDCNGPPPLFHLPPPPVPPGECDLVNMACPSTLNISDAEFKKIGTFPSVTVIVCCTLLSAIILLVIAGFFWRKKRKGMTQTKDFDHHHHNGPMMNGNGILYEDLSHARPRPPIAPPIEMLDVNHHGIVGTDTGMMTNPKLDFSYFLNPPPIYEELPDHLSDRNNLHSDDEFAEDELSVIDVPSMVNGGAFVENIARYGQNGTPINRVVGVLNGTNNKLRNSSHSLSRKRNNGRVGNGTRGGSATFKSSSQRSLDRRNIRNGGLKYPGTNPRPSAPYSRHNISGQHDLNNPNGNSMLLLANNGMTMKIPPHLLAVLTESALCNGQNGIARPYEVIQAANVVNGGGIYPSSRSSGSSYGDGGGGGSSSASSRNNPGSNNESHGSFDSGIHPHSITSFINAPSYDQSIPPPAYPAYEYSTGGNGQAALTSQHPSFRRLRMTERDRDHPLYSNHLLT